jgi:S-adenosylmethionine hydrolase
MAIISLITDFGVQDEYVGLMKAVILGIDPAAVIVDVSHNVILGNISQAAFMLESAYGSFPPGSIHLVVVDPGVGTSRPLLYLEAHTHRFIAPDNGVLSLVMGRPPEILLRRLDNPAWRRPFVSPTFHGRDIMAPAAAHLSRGADVREVGPEFNPNAVTVLTDLRAQPSDDGRVTGRVVHIDRFGNLVTNVPQAAIRKVETVFSGRTLAVRIGEQMITGLSATYADGEAGRPLALIGSRGYLEIAVNGGNAQHYFGIRPGDAVNLGTVE